MSLDEKVRKEVNNALDKAEAIWDEVGHHFEKSLEGLDEVVAFSGSKPVETKIPGFAFIEEGKPQVAQFVAQVLDIRGSTKHLIQRIGPPAKASQLQRVLFETTAINTAGAVIIEHYNGGITEYLGDGYLALFKQEENEPGQDVYNAYNSANYYMYNGLSIINNILSSRYVLPSIEMGIGMAYSKAIVTLIGRGKNLHPKAIGECVYRASKIADGINEIKIDERLNLYWPKSDDGKISFFNLGSSRYKFKAYKIK